MAGDRPITDYTNRDYASLLASLLDQAAVKFPEWTDRSENDLGRMLLESFAYVGDVLLYYQDRIANEAFLSTAVERRSVIDLLSLIGYTLATPAPASADLEIVVLDDTVDSVRIGDENEGGIARFATQASPGKPAVEFIYLPPQGQPQVFRRPEQDPFKFKISIINAQQIRNEVIGTSSEEANQSFRLKQQPVLLPRDPESQTVYLTVEVGSDGQFTQWKKQETLLYSLSDSPHFTVQINENDEAEIVFGDGTYGQIPPLDSTIRATYLIGSGAVGNVGPNTITKVKSGVASGSGGKVSIEVTNKKAAAGGADRESIAHARRQAPGVFRSWQRAVTEADYVALAENFPGVERAIAIPTAWNYVDLYVVAAGNFLLTQDLHDKLLAYFQEKRMVTTLVNVRSPVFVTIEITVDELGVESTFYRDDVEQRSREAIAALFAMERLKFGQSFYLSKIYEALENVSGVDFVRGVSFQGSRSQPPDEIVEAENGLIQLRPREFPRPSAGLVNFNQVKGGLG